MSYKHSYFDLLRLRNHIQHFAAIMLYPEFNEYAQFNERISLLTSTQLLILIERLLSTGKLDSCSFGVTGGSTGRPKIIPNALWRQEHKTQYARALKSQIQENFLTKADVVANLCSAGGFSLLYDGFNRLLEAIACSILPIGRIDTFSVNHQRQMLEWAKKLSVNTLIGTPSSILQLLNFAQKFNCHLRIEKIIFTGEPFSNAKRRYIHSFWQDAKIYGLYGHTETGFIGFNTPACPADAYHIFEDWFFIENTPDHEIIVTSLADTLLPIIRYKVGDRGRLLENPCICGRKLPLLLIQDRTDSQFNFSGNLIAKSVIAEVLSRICDEAVDFQIQIDTEANGTDILKLVLDISPVDLQAITEQLMMQLLSIAMISECVDREVGKILLCSREEFVYTERQKLPAILDKRGIDMGIYSEKSKLR